MKIIFLGIMFCDEALDKAYKESLHGITMSPHVFQKNLFSGFNQIKDIDFEVINIPPTGSFLINNRKLISKKYCWGKNNIQIGYLNIPIIKQIEQKYKILNELKHRIRAIKKYSDVTLIAYSSYEPFLDVFTVAKKKYPGIQLCLIQTDPILGRGERERYMTPSAIKKGNRIVSKIRIVDKFVILTKYLADSLEINDRPYCIVECICDANQPIADDGLNRNICLYTGSLNSDFGIKELVEAFTFINNGELWICGDGNSKEYIIEKASAYKNIKYYGYLDRNGVLKLQNKCDFLINPRRPSGTYTMYSFPSKTAEYMMTGKPVIMYKLEGLPDEYDEHLFFLKEKDSKSISCELEKVFNTDNSILKSKGVSGRNFILINKNPKEQAKKIIDLLYETKYI